MSRVLSSGERPVRFGFPPNLGGIAAEVGVTTLSEGVRTDAAVGGTPEVSVDTAASGVAAGAEACTAVSGVAAGRGLAARIKRDSCAHPQLTRTSHTTRGSSALRCARSRARAVAQRPACRRDGTPVALAYGSPGTEGRTSSRMLFGSCLRPTRCERLRCGLPPRRHSTGASGSTLCSLRRVVVLCGWASRRGVVASGHGPPRQGKSVVVAR